MKELHHGFYIKNNKTILSIIQPKSDFAKSLFTILNLLIYYPTYYPKGVFGSKKQKTPLEEGF